jgi:hypothetical protein
VVETHTVFAAGFPAAYFLLQTTALIFLRGGWQIVAVVLALTMACALALFLIGIALSEPSVAVPLSIGLPLATLILCALWLAYAVARIGRQA